MPKKAHQIKQVELSADVLHSVAKKICPMLNKMTYPLRFLNIGINLDSDSKATITYELPDALDNKAKMNALAHLKDLVKKELKRLGYPKISLELSSLEISIPPAVVNQFAAQIQSQLIPQETATVLREKAEEKEENLLYFWISCFNKFILKQADSLSHIPDVNKFLNSCDKEIPDGFNYLLKDYPKIATKLRRFANTLSPGIMQELEGMNLECSMEDWEKLPPEMRERITNNNHTAEDKAILLSMGAQKNKGMFCYFDNLDSLDGLPWKQRWFEVNKRLSIISDLTDTYEQDIAPKCEYFLSTFQQRLTTLKKIKHCCAGIPEECLTKLGVSLAKNETLASTLRSYENTMAELHEKYTESKNKIDEVRNGLIAQQANLISYLNELNAEREREREKERLAKKINPVPAVKKTYPEFFPTFSGNQAAPSSQVHSKVEAQAEAQAELEKQKRKEELRRARAPVDENNTQAEEVKDDGSDEEESITPFYFSFTSQGKGAHQQQRVPCIKLPGMMEDVLISTSPARDALFQPQELALFQSELKKIKILRRDGLGKNGIKIYSDKLAVVKVNDNFRIICISKKAENSDALVYIPVQVIKHKRYEKLLDSIASQTQRLEGHLDHIKIFTNDLLNAANQSEPTIFGLVGAASSAF